ncbi:MAG: carbonic anhydrase [Actinobacteria bacterium]|nr:carbonic anhydrase [Actinomycetota bacterium]
MSRGVIDEVVEANRRVAAGVATSLSSRPARALAIVVCMDARIDPLVDFGLARGDVHVIRNAGGRVTEDVLRSLAASWYFLDSGAVMVVHHTDCGMFTSDPDEPRRQLERMAGSDLGDVDLLAFTDEDGSVREDVDKIRSWSLTPQDTEVRGFVYDLGSGLLREVAGDT